MDNRTLRPQVFASGILVLAIAGPDLAGCALDVPILRNLALGLAPMGVVTDLCLMAGSIALLLALLKPPASWSQWTSGGLGLLVALTAFITFASQARPVAQESEWGALSVLLSPPYRIAPVTALCLLILGVCFALVASGRRGAVEAAHALVLPVAFGGGLILIGYLFNAPELETWMGARVALKTGVALCVLCAGTLFLGPDTWLMRGVTDPGPGGRIVRYLLPALVVVAVVIGWAWLSVHEVYGYSASLASALAVAANGGVLLVVIWMAARSAAKTDEKRRSAEEALAAKHRDLSTIFDSVPAMIFYKDRENRFLRVNREFSRRMGLPKEKLESRSLFDIYPKDQAQAYWKDDREVLASGVPKASILEPMQTENDLRWVQTEKLPYRNEAGEITGIIGLSLDITERKEAEKEIVRLASFPVLNPNPILEADLEGRVSFVNPSAKALFPDIEERGAAHPWLTGWKLLTGPSDSPAHGPSTREVRVDGRWYHQTFHRLSDTGRIRVYGLDITARKQAEQDLQKLNVELESRVATQTVEIRRASAYNRSLIEASLDPLVTISPEGTITDVNAATEVATGRAREELVGTDFSTYFTEPGKARAGYEQVFREGYVRDYPLEIRHKNGRVTPVLYNASVYWDDKGQMAGTFAAARDITERLRAEAALREVNETLELRVARRTEDLRASEERFRAIASNTPDHILVQDRNLKYTFVLNPQLGLTEKDMIGRTDSDFLSRDDADKLTQIKRQVLETRAPFRLETSLVNREGKVEFFEGIYVPSLSEAGEADGLIGYFKNATERKSAEQERQRMIEELARSNQDLEQFAYVTSHDLKEPLRMVTGFTSLLREQYAGRLDEQADEYIRFASEASDRMRGLIDDLLAYARIGRGALEERADTNSVLDRALANLQASVTESGARVTREVLPAVTANSSELTQVFQNLVGNAIKFRKEAVAPEIHLGVRRLDPEDRRSGEPRTADGGERLPPPVRGMQNPAWLFSVRDNGIGIDPQYSEKLFVIFQRLHTREEYPGTGVGLAICKKIIEGHGGRIWFQSAPGQGATFYFTVPA